MSWQKRAKTFFWGSVSVWILILVLHLVLDIAAELQWIDLGYGGW